MIRQGYIINSTNYDAGIYRFGFNGQEKDQEIYNNQSTTTATFWEYDGRIGRRWNLDPKPTIGISDYACLGNNPIFSIDPYGDKVTTTVEKYKKLKDGSEKKLRSISFRKADRIEITHKVNGFKLIDRSGKIGKERSEKAAKDIQKEIDDYWNTDGYVYNARGQKLSVKTIFETNIEVVNDVSEINAEDHIIAFNSPSQMEYMFGANGGEMQQKGNGTNIIFAYNYTYNKAGQGLFAHEWGHILGLMILEYIDLVMKIE